MSTRIEPITLTDAETQDDVVGQLLYGLSYDELRLIDGVWRPYLALAEVEMDMRGADRSTLPDTRGWDWQGKLTLSQATLGLSDWNFLGIAYKKHMQGAIVVSETPRPCRAQAHVGLMALGVEFVAAAPWNLKQFMRSLGRRPFLELVGQTLFKVAISYSRAAGCNGRLYLYSVPKAESYYATHCGMIDVGLEYYHGETLRRFEMTEEQATTLMNR